MREKVVLSTIKRKAMRFPCVVGARQMSGPGQLRMGPERGLGLGLLLLAGSGQTKRGGRGSYHDQNEETDEEAENSPGPAREG